MTEYVQIITTTETEEDARRIAAQLVEQRLAACAQVLGPVTSTYHWQGKIETAGEWQCCIKSRRDLYPALESVIRDLHPYDEPEILAMPVVAGSQGYLDWMERELRGSDNS